MLGPDQVPQVPGQQRPRLLLLHGLERGLQLVVRLGLALKVVLDLADLLAWKRISIEIYFPINCVRVSKAFSRHLITKRLYVLSLAKQESVRFPQ